MRSLTALIFAKISGSRSLRGMALGALSALLWNCGVTDQPAWELFDQTQVHSLYVNGSGAYQMGALQLVVEWQRDLNYSENLGAYGGIRVLQIFRDRQLLQTLNHVEDALGLGFISFEFYDFNMDGYPDFRIPLNERWPQYYLYDPKKGLFEHRPDWDYLRIQSIDRSLKRIQTIPDGNAMEAIFRTYQVKGLNLVEISTSI